MLVLAAVTYPRLRAGFRAAIAITAGFLAVVGVVVRLAWMHAPSGLVAAVYLVAGWQMMVAFPAYTAGLTGRELALLAVGGALYTLGAIVYALRRPNPWPHRQCDRYRPCPAPRRLDWPHPPTANLK